MKKPLLLVTGALIGMTAIAAEPVAVPEFMFEAVSPNGEWTAGNDAYQNLMIYHIPTGSSYSFEPSEDQSTSYSVGTGNYVSNVGVVAIDISEIGPAAVWDNGNIIELPVSSFHTSSHANGITPDATRICGNLGQAEMSLDDVIMQTPVVWTRNADGEWNDCISLPYPKVDFTGRVPQYILANAISADGKTIAGMIRDYSGMIMQPIVWKENEDGEWAYSLPNPELINPNGVVFPEWPGDSPEWVDASDYMTPEENEAYQAALMEYYNTWENEPNPVDFMTPEEATAYNEAKKAYEAAYAKWETEFNDYIALLDSVEEEAVLFVMNNVYLSPNGRYYAASHEYSSMWEGVKEAYPVVLDLETGEAILKKSDIPLSTTYINDNGTLMAAEQLMPMSVSRNAWICPSLDDEFITLSEYIEPSFPSVYTWMEENMKHDMESYDTETWEPVIIPDVWQTGRACADDNLSTIVSFTQNTWDYDSEYFIYSYVLPLNNGTSAASDKSINSFGINAAKGTVRINGAAALLEVFDLNGRRVLSIDNPSARVNTGLNSGFYIIKATSKDGKVVTCKASI